MFKKFPAVISNNLIKNLHADAENNETILTVMEYKILFALISKIKKSDKKLLNYDIPVVDFCKFWDISYGGNQNKIISESVNSLSEKSYYTNNNPIKYLTSESNVTNGIMHLQLDDSIYDYVINLDGNFTVFNLDIIEKFKSKFAIRLYMFFKMLENQKFYNINLPDAFKTFGDNIYLTKSQFNNNILKRSISEINSKSDISISYKFEKRFAEPEVIRFFIKPKNQQEKTTNIHNHKSIDIYVDPDPYTPNLGTIETVIIDESTLPF